MVYQFQIFMIKTLKKHIQKRKKNKIRSVLNPRELGNARVKWRNWGREETYTSVNLGEDEIR